MEGSIRDGSGVWWTTDGVNVTGDLQLAQPCPEGLPPALKSVVSPE